MKIRLVFVKRRTSPLPSGGDQYLWNVIGHDGRFVCQYAAMVDSFWSGEPMPRLWLGAE